MRLIAQLVQSGFIDFGETKQYSFVRYKLIYFQITMEEGIVNEAKLFLPEWIRNELEVKNFVYCTLECFNTEGKLHLVHEDYEAYSLYVDASIFLGNSLNNVINNGLSHYLVVRVKLMGTKVILRVVKEVAGLYNQ